MARPFIAIAAALVAVFLCAAPLNSAENRIDTTVKIKVPDGHGSGVYIGENHVLTAAHVVNGQAGLIKVIAANGNEKLATVVWLNTDYDIALIRIKGDVQEGLAQAALSCGTPDVGEPLTAYGSPGPNDFLRFDGYVAGPVTEKHVWREVVTVDMTILPGMSGGPVFDADGDLAGISVGVAVMRGGMVRIGFVVPGSTICRLMV